LCTINERFLVTDKIIYILIIEFLHIYTFCG
jgi:hypothetical protein